MKRRFQRSACLCLLLFATSVSLPASDDRYTRDALIEDAYQLRDTIEEAHPDPYLNGGGKIAFHRRFRDLLERIPAEGMTRDGFLNLLGPFVAAVGDSHTAVINAAGQSTPVTLPLQFKIVEEQLVVDRVALEEQRPLIGSLLTAVEDVPLAELIERQGRLRGLENRYGKLAFMIFRTLKTRQNLGQLIPEWTKGGKIEVHLLQPDGSTASVELELLGEPPDQWISPPSAVSMPDTTSSDVAYTFLDSDRTTALLVIRDLMRYREACEMWFADGFDQAEAMTRAAYEHFHQTPAPENREDLLTGVPSATSTIAEMVDEMRAFGTKNLIVDLRGNTGGSSVMREILVYLLFGDRAMRDLDDGYQITKISAHLLEQYAASSLADINAGRTIPLRINDYDFKEEQTYHAERGSQTTPEEEPSLARSPSFWETYRTGKFHSPRWSPARIAAISDPLTFSSGFNVLSGLYSLGAVTVGTPSAQPPNNFGDMLLFELQHTGIQAGVSHKQIVAFPDEPEIGRCLRPEIPLTFEQLAASGFDPNAEVLLALDVLQRSRDGRTRPDRPATRRSDRIEKQVGSPHPSIGERSTSPPSP